MAYTLDLHSLIKYMYPVLYVSLYWLYSEKVATLGPPSPNVTAVKEKEYKVESILRHHLQGWAMEYLMHWHGNDEAENNWALKQDLVHIQKTLEK